MKRCAVAVVQEGLVACAGFDRRVLEAQEEEERLREERRERKREKRVRNKAPPNGSTLFGNHALTACGLHNCPQDALEVAQGCMFSKSLCLDTKLDAGFGVK